MLCSQSHIIATLDCCGGTLQAGGPDAIEQRQDDPEEAVDEDPAETAEDPIQQAEQITQDKLAARFVTSAR